MKRISYGERDHAFGQLMLTLRMATGLTQAGLADLLGLSRHAVGGWESGQSYPKADRLKAFIAFGLEQHIFTAGKEAGKSTRCGGQRTRKCCWMIYGCTNCSASSLPLG